MNIQITDSYHRLRVQELELTADYLAKTAEEKERAREERARLREEEIARREYEREQERLRKEYAHYQATAAALREQGDLDGAARTEARLTEIQDAIDGINRRAANVRAGTRLRDLQRRRLRPRHGENRHDPATGADRPDPRTG